MKASDISAVSALLWAVACAPAAVPRVVSPEGLHPPDWSPTELAQETSVRKLRQTTESTHLLLRTQVSEKPHVHDRSDLTATLLSGEVVLHLGESSHLLEPGSVMFIPRGTPHWLELAPGASASAYVIFSPPFDPQDRRFLTSESPAAPTPP